MSNKYIIKNCPFYLKTRRSNYCDLDAGSCQDCTDCLLKQIVEKLKNPNNCRYSGKPLVFTDELLKLLDIQEVE